MTRRRAALTLLGAGVAILALPAHWEGPRLIEISEGHAISLLDAIGIAPLIVGATLLQLDLWRRREALLDRVREKPARGIRLSFITGLGLGLLVASAFSGFWWWWAIGALLLALVLFGFG